MNNNQDNFEDIKYNYFLEQLKQLIPDIKNFNDNVYNVYIAYICPKWNSECSKQ